MKTAVLCSIRLTVGLIAVSFTATVTVNAQFPSFPPDNVTNTMDRDQMMWQLGLSFPALPPKLDGWRRPYDHTVRLWSLE
jgi:hypothetical protein